MKRPHIFAALVGFGVFGVVSLALLFFMPAQDPGSPSSTEPTPIALGTDLADDELPVPPATQTPEDVRKTEEPEEVQKGDGDAEQAADAEESEAQLRRIRALMDAYRIRHLEERASKGRDGDYERFLQSTFGELPLNPIAALADLDDTTLTRLLREQATTFGDHLATNVTLRDSLAWFEEAGASSGLDGQVQARILYRVVQHHATQVPIAADQARRILALLDAQLAAWQGQPSDLRAGLDLIRSFHKICPVDGGLDLIRRWTVEKPHGHSTIEAQLAKALEFWPLRECQYLALEILGTRRTGAINGIIDTWSPTPNKKWTGSEFKSLIVPAIVDAVKETKSSWALVTALVARDVAEPHFGSIADALFARRDSPSCTAYGFSFLSAAGQEEFAQTMWRAWLWSGDTYKAEAACKAAYISGMKPASETTEAMDRMLELALSDAEPASLRAAAATTLCVRDRDSRSPAILEAWIAEAEIDGARLLALGRIALCVPDARCQSILEARINDISSTPALRHYPLFLLAVSLPERALELCEADLDGVQRSFSNEAILLAAAAAEGGIPGTAERTAELRRRIPDTEPEWMRQMRLRIDPPDPSPEQKVARLARK